MKIRNSIIITFLLLFAINFSSCGKITLNNDTQINKTYYSISTAYSDYKEKNYMTLNVKIPTINYSMDYEDESIDKVSKDMMEQITALIVEAENNAKSTYEAYIESAKTNVLIDRENRIEALKKKYKNVIGPDEVKELNELKNMELDYSMPSIRFPFGNRKKVEDDVEVTGFTNDISDDQVIIDGLHNKKIIVIETKENRIDDDIKIKIATASDNRKSKDYGKRKEIFPSSRSFIKKRDGFHSTSSDLYKETDDNAIGDDADYKENDDTSKIDEKAKDEIIIKDNVDDKAINYATTSEVIEDEPTIDDFYRELGRIKRIRIPSIMELERQYIPTNIVCDYNIKCLDDKYLSLFIELSESRTTVSIKRYYYNIDLTKKVIIDIKDILGDNYKEKCKTIIEDDIKNWPDEKKSLLHKEYDIDAILNNHIGFFINNNNTPVIELDKHSITVGIAGYLEFEIN